MNKIANISDDDLLLEIKRRFNEKNSSLSELDFLNKKLLDLNKQLVEMDSVKSRFLSLIKNEFNNPISSVLNLCGHLISKKRPEKFDEITEMIHMEVLRLDFQIKNIICASEIEAGETTNYYSKIDINEILEEAKQSVRYTIKDKNLTLSISNELNNPICSDAHKIYLICLNLLSNACEYSYDNANVYIKISEENGKISMRFEDCGEGIIADNKHLVYNRFAQFNRGINRARTGLGLGLSVVKGLVEALEGSVDYESDPEKQTVFTALLPIIHDSNCFISGGSNDLLFENFDNAIEL